jgi:hypothetical protein
MLRGVFLRIGMISESKLWPGGQQKNQAAHTDGRIAEGYTAFEAYRYAFALLESKYQLRVPAGFELSKGCQPPSCLPHRVKRCLEDSGVQFVKMSINEDNYASWVMPLGALSGDTSKVYIAIDPGQIEIWENESGMPKNVQETRVMIHEFAHFLFHPRLTVPSPMVVGAETGTKRANISTPEEEEQAWVFAFMFLALVMGDYSLKCRRAVNIDNTPGRFI